MTAQTRLMARTIARAQRHMFTRTRLLADQMLCDLEKNMETSPAPKMNAALWGEKETYLTALAKITQILLKVAPAERELHAPIVKEKVKDRKEVAEPVSHYSLEELVLFERFIDERKQFLKATSAECD